MGLVVHFEGIPGAGKTTAARDLGECLIARGADAFWTLEEAADHPITTRARRAQSSCAEFPADEAF